MRTVAVHRADTHFSDPLLLEYLQGNRLRELYSVPPDLEGLQEICQTRKGFDPVKREALVNALRRQYRKSGIDDSKDTIGKQLAMLEKPDAYTVTTGQQIHVGLGPLYVLYKIVDVLRLAKTASKQLSCPVIPIFWMATEDHDFEEIRDMNVFGRTFRWEHPHGGAVGRLDTDGLQQLVSQVKDQFRWEGQQLKFIELLSQGYGIPNFADATRWILHQLFGMHGLVVLDGDDPVLKSLFKDVMLNELKGTHREAAQLGSNALRSMGYPLQIHVHQCNLFQLGKNTRVKLESSKDRDHKGTYISAESAEAWMDAHFSDCSPNVALRPLYQEWILPNLAYIGGAAEIRYWLQLGGYFKTYAQRMPLLIPRSSYVVLPSSVHKSMNSRDIEKYYMDLAPFSEVVEQELSDQRITLHKKLQQIQDSLKAYSNEVEQLVPGVRMAPKLNKAIDKIVDIEQFTDDMIATRMKDDPKLKKALKARERYFNADSPQERTEHWIAFAGLETDLLCQENWSIFDNLLNINHLLLD